ncbi:NAD(P)/FAD-dependent oxidoreductase [Shewanella sp. SNU WT4]|uniref:NAD(P)/FAD-dependent oxidoreductase n=1 Tax=Shewanella sp. SNU WT4 TaxID=2590015 RepID=UPI00112907EC|nr:NAD(P)/FAD-dependent oxidoreductase [Shewanella sp. SNU WT4]QDF66206.1 NAD(P)/FAD-dependent oxidoreductase [Shewanella sp. SNU WT4]
MISAENSTTSHTLPRIVIVGGGAGGLELASALGHKLGKKGRAEIVLIDKSRSHIWKPLLHEVATGSLDADLDGVIYSVHAMQHGYRFELGEMIGMDCQAQHISLAAKYDQEGKLLSAERQLNYDQLVLAVGSVSNDFNTKGVKQHCYFLDSHAQAQRFHHALLDNFTRVHQNPDVDSLNIAIVGGGATGVELSADLYHVAKLIKSYGLAQMTPAKLKIQLIEAGPRILPALPERISASARKELSLLGVEVMENVRINEATEEGFVTSEGQLIAAQMMVWAAGVKAPDFIANIEGLSLTRSNQILVEPTLHAKGQENLFVIGDCCACELPDGGFVPPRAQSAHQMASCVYKNILNRRSGKAEVAYKYVDHGSLVNLSRFSTVGSLMGNLNKNSMFVEGKIARLVYLSLYRMHQYAIHGAKRMMALWLAEKLMRAVRPKMKLH